MRDLRHPRAAGSTSFHRTIVQQRAGYIQRLVTIVSGRVRPRHAAIARAQRSVPPSMHNVWWDAVRSRARAMAR